MLRLYQDKVLGLMLVFAEEPVMEDMPTAVATLTDEFGNAHELDIE